MHVCAAWVLQGGLRIGNAESGITWTQHTPDPNRACLLLYNATAGPCDSIKACSRLVGNTDTHNARSKQHTVQALASTLHWQGSSACCVLMSPTPGTVLVIPDLSGIPGKICQASLENPPTLQAGQHVFQPNLLNEEKEIPQHMLHWLSVCALSVSRPWGPPTALCTCRNILPAVHNRVPNPKLTKTMLGANSIRTPDKP